MNFHEWKPKVVTLCGSTKFTEAFRAENLRLTLDGNIVLTVGCDTKSDDQLKLSPEQKENLDLLHFKKIEMGDEIRVLNVNGYVGDSTAREFAYARWIGKPISWLVMIPTVVEMLDKLTTGGWKRQEQPRSGETPWLTKESVEKLLKACEEIKSNPIAVYHFKGEV